MNNLNDLIKHQQQSNKMINMSIDELQNLFNMINGTEKSINKLQHKSDTGLKVYKSTYVSILQKFACSTSIQVDEKHVCCRNYVQDILRIVEKLYRWLINNVTDFTMRVW